MTYSSFLAGKAHRSPAVGDRVDPGDLHPALHPWQADVVAWAVERGRAALWEDTGLGKTRQQLEWARRSIPAGGTALILAPLAVCRQTIREATALDLEVRYTPDGDIGPGVWITNYERAERMPRHLGAVVLDEGSILRDSTGKTRTLLIDQFSRVPRRLTATATPAPNEAEELTNQAEFVGSMSRVDMLASFYVHDDNRWRIKGHAHEPMAAWMAQWAMALRRPSDLGYPDDGYLLPGLDIVPEVVDVDLEPPDGEFFAVDLGGVGGRARVRRETLAARCDRVAALVDAEPAEPWVIWCGLNDEATRLARDIPGAVNVHGAMSPEEKAEALLGFADGAIRHIITKPSIGGRGMNWQRSARHAFAGLGDSFEDYYQCIRRSLRYGQTRRVRAHIVVSQVEQQIVRNVERKQAEHQRAMGALVTAMRRARGWEESAA